MLAIPRKVAIRKISRDSLARDSSLKTFAIIHRAKTLLLTVIAVSYWPLTAQVESRMMTSDGITTCLSGHEPFSIN